MSPANDPAMAAHFAREQASGGLLQRVLLAGTRALASGAFDDRLVLGPAKLHLHEADLPETSTATCFVRDAHLQGRPVAVHCTTETELVFALSVIREAGAAQGDRIEHAGIASDPLLRWIAELGLGVVAQPHFIAERGDRYISAVAPRDLPHLYRLRSFLDAGVTLAGGSDAPFGEPDPWAAMAAAVSRMTRNGLYVGREEALTPDEALALFIADPGDLSRQRRIIVGAPADLCLLDRPWEKARRRLSAHDVRLTMIGGSIVHNRIDQPPIERGSCADPLT
jgi:predicted amidohydrolase YtcJ